MLNYNGFSIDTDLPFLITDSIPLYQNLDIPKKVGLDIGAHVGCNSILMVECGFSKIIAVEPNIDNYLRLVRNVYANDLQDIIIPLNCAIYNKNSFMNLMSCGFNSGCFSLHYPDNFKDMYAQPVMLLNLIDLINAVVDNYGKIDYMKFDTEGAEYDVFTGDYFNLIKPLLEDIGWLDLCIHKPPFSADNPEYKDTCFADDEASEFIYQNMKSIFENRVRFVDGYKSDDYKVK